MDSVQQVARSARRFFRGTLISRATGFLRDIVTAAAFGGTPSVAAFLMAYRFANLPRRLLGEGAMHSAFVPHYQKEGADFAKALMVVLSIVLSAIVLIVCPFFIFSQSEVLRFTGLMLPVVVFLCLHGLNAALLNCHQVYFLPSVAPAAFNVIWIISALLVPNLTYLAIAVVIADAVQWLVTLPVALRFLRGATFDFRSLIPFSKVLFLAMLGVGATQINSACDPIFGRLADPSGPAYLWYAIRLQQLPLALFGVGLTHALLPPISKAIKMGEDHTPLIRFAYRTAIILSLPVTALLIFLPVVKWVYAYGAFSALDVFYTTKCLRGYAAGLLPQILVMIRSATYYARGDYKIPAIISAVSVVGNLSLNTLFVMGLGWGAESVAYATAISSIVQIILLEINYKPMYPLPSE